MKLVMIADLFNTIKKKMLYANNEQYEWVEDPNHKYLDLLIKKISKKYNTVLSEYTKMHKNVGYHDHPKNNEYLKIIQEINGSILSADVGVKYDPNYNQDAKIIKKILPVICWKK